MRKNNIQTKIVRIPLSPSSKPQDIKPRFQSMPILYLELLENKKKVIQEVINKDYIPENKEGKSRGDKYEEGDDDKEEERENKYKNKYREESDDDRRDEREEDRRADRDKYKDKYREDDDSYDEKSRDSRGRNRDRSIDESRERSRGDRREDRRGDRSRERSRGERDDKCRDKYRKSSRNSIASSRNSDLSERLRNILKEDSDSERSVDSKKYEKSKSRETDRSKSREKNKYRNVERDLERGFDKPSKIPPPLSELEARGQIQINKEMKDINYMNMADDDDAKREILLKFEILKKSYAKSTVPEFTIHSDLNTMKKSYETTLKRLSLDSSVDGYKQFLIAGFLGAEFVIGNWLNFDMKGFTRQQIVQMNKYERLLIELGEKSYVPQESKWPVEMRLLSMIIMNAAFFVLTKMVANKSGANLLDMFNSMSSGLNNTEQANNSNNKPVKKNRMKGPEIDIEDLPDVNT